MLAMCKYIVHFILVYKWHFMCVVKGSKILIIYGVMNECWTIPTVNVMYTKPQNHKTMVADKHGIQTFEDMYDCSVVAFVVIA